MAFDISFLESALDDIEEGRAWYVERSADVASRFKKAVFACVDALPDDVVRYRSVYR